MKIFSFVQIIRYSISIMSFVSYGFISPRTSKSTATSLQVFKTYWSSSLSNLSSQKIVLLDKLKNVQPNGLTATKIQQKEIETLVSQIEKNNPTKSPSTSDLMNGYWRLLYTDFDPPAESSGKLGPFVGDVFQDLNSKKLLIKNILKVGFPSIIGALTANLSIPNGNTWYVIILLFLIDVLQQSLNTRIHSIYREIEFDRVENSIFGIPLPSKVFPPKSQIRVWRITYLDQDLRIMRAGRPESKPSEYFIFILRRENNVN